MPYAPDMRLGLWGLQPLVAAEVERLRTEAIKNPVGIDVKHPAFSWTLEAGDERGISQKAYEINVSPMRHIPGKYGPPDG